MTYKARRTRDLQGEVKAGTGISVTVSVKPDGTKEYTITNGDPASAITVSGEGLSLIANVLMNTMAARMGWNDTTGALEWYDDNGDPFVKLRPTDEVLISDANDGAGFFIKQLAGDTNKLISGDIQIAEDPSSTEGVSLQTLADMINSTECYQLYPSWTLSDGQAFYFPDGTSVSQTDFYEDGETQYIINGHAVYGIKIKKTGDYHISIRIEAKIDSTTTINDAALNIITIDDNGNKNDIYNYIGVVNYMGYTEYVAVFTIDVIVPGISEGDTLSFEMVIGNGADVTSMYSWSNDPYITIQKVR